MIFSIYITPFYNSINKQYQQVLIIEPKPNDPPLSNFVKTVPYNNLSTFTPRSNLSCLNLLVSNDFYKKSEKNFLTPDDIPFFMDFLQNNNFLVSDFKIQFNNPLPVKKTFIFSFKTNLS